MKNKRFSGEGIRLKVPVYRQNYDFTCGPASLIMAMKYFEPGIQLSEELEIDIWREANMVELYGTSRYGLAYSAAARGFKVKVLSNRKSYGYVDRLQPAIECINRRMLKLLFEERRRRCLVMGVDEEIVTITPEILRKAILSKMVPIMLTSTDWFSREDIPHWVAVTGIKDNNTVYINNPIGPPIARIVRKPFEEIAGYKGDQCAVLIGRRHASTSAAAVENQKQ